LNSFLVRNTWRI